MFRFDKKLYFCCFMNETVISFVTHILLTTNFYEQKSNFIKFQTDRRCTDVLCNDASLGICTGGGRAK